MTDYLAGNECNVPLLVWTQINVNFVGTKKIKTFKF